LISTLLAIIKIVFLLGFLIGIHETGHFLIAKLCKVKVNEFSIGFGPVIWRKETKETKYALRLIPLGGFVRMEGEEERSDNEGSFSKASVPRRIAIVAAGAIVNIIFALIIYFILSAVIISQNAEIASNFQNTVKLAGSSTAKFATETIEGVKNLFTGKITKDQLIGPVGISEVVAKTNGFAEFTYILAVISISLGVTNLIPFPPLDGGKILLLIIEAIRRKPLKEDTEIKIQLLGFAILIGLSIFVTFNDIVRIL
jgi:regulator of sigma E protease